MTTYWVVVTLLAGTTKTIVTPFERHLFTTQGKCASYKDLMTKAMFGSLPTHCMEMYYKLELDGSIKLQLVHHVADL